MTIIIKDISPKVVRANIDGCLVMKSYLHGTPRIDMALNGDFMYRSSLEDGIMPSGTLYFFLLFSKESLHYAFAFIHTFEENYQFYHALLLLRTTFVSL